MQLAHHLLSLSTDIRFVIGGQVAAYDPSWSPTCAYDSAAAARKVAALAGRNDVPVIAGSNEVLSSITKPRKTPAAEAIIEEAMRDDTDSQLIVVCGGSLTNIASAWLMEPRTPGII